MLIAKRIALLAGNIVDGLPNLALGRPAYASSTLTWGSVDLLPKYAVDGVTQYFNALSSTSPQIFHSGGGDDR
jgi:hypothetical protein